MDEKSLESRSSGLLRQKEGDLLDFRREGVRLFEH
jgi:hypothetical protein